MKAAMACFRLQQAKEAFRMGNHLEAREREEALEHAEQRRQEEEHCEDKCRRKLNEMAQKREMELFRLWQEREAANYEEQL